MPTEMRHLLIFLPGLMGSALQKDGRDVWALSGQALWQFLRTLGDSLNILRIAQDDGQTTDLGDGLKAVRLIEDVHSIPGVMEHAGYSVVVQRLKETFDVEEGSIHAPHDSANFFTFPYDWRRDGRVTARQLQAFIDQQLPRWREHSGASEAEVILIGHSMGGLVSRYYVEMLEGWRNCHTLITVGSPHRGSPNALNTLVNGVNPLLDQLNGVVRSFESLYQVLPTYPVVRSGDGHKRLIELEALGPADLGRVRSARKNFLGAIAEQAPLNARDPDYRTYTIPWLGTHQPTTQSAEWQNGRLVMSQTLPTGLSNYLAGGDGTVPRVSAVPLELDGKGKERFAIERHGWLTNNPMSLSPLLDTLTQLISGGASDFFGVPEQTLAGLSLYVEPVYLQGEPVIVRVQLVSENEQSQPVELKVTPKNQAGKVVTQTALANSAEACEVVLGELDPGLYELTAAVLGDQSQAPVHGLFEIPDSR